MQVDSYFGEGALMGEKEAEGARYECAGASARGCLHRENQDRFRISDGGIVLCDGIGGADAGEVFAEASCWQCDRLLATNLEVDEIIANANDKAIALGDVLGGRGGSSICIAKFCQDGSVDIGSRGDVLAIRISENRLSIVNKPDYSTKRKLRSYIGDKSGDAACCQKYCAMPLNRFDECFVFLTDGIWKSVSSEDIISTWHASGCDAEAMATALVRLAGRYGSLDDRTAIICKRMA